MSLTKIIPIDHIDSGVKDCITNAGILLEVSKILHGKYGDAQSISIFLYALSEFGKAVLLRDKKILAEYNNQPEIDATDFFYDNYKKIDAALRTAGPNVEIIKLDGMDLQHAMEFLRVPNNSLNIDIGNLMLVDFNSNDSKWEQRLANKTKYIQNNAFTVLTKMLKKWENFYWFEDLNNTGKNFQII